MLQWLKDILGENHTEDIDKKVSAEIGKNFVSRTDFNTINEEKKTLSGQIKERDTQLEELKKVDAEGLQAKIAELQEANKTADTEHKAQMATLQKTSALKLALADKVHDPDDIIGKLELDKVEFDGENMKTSVDDLLKPFKADKPYLFKTETNTVTGTKPMGAADPNKGEPSTLETQINSIFGLK